MTAHNSIYHMTTPRPFVMRLTHVKTALTPSPPMSGLSLKSFTLANRLRSSDLCICYQKIMTPFIPKITNIDYKCKTKNARLFLYLL